jgi:PIN domain nuclease of toxin-antitoxin system
VFDASAVLALLNREPGWEQVEAVAADAEISTVNLSEVMARLTERGVPDKAAWEIVTALDLTLVPFSAGHAREAARLRSATKALGLGLGDRACLALARVAKRPVYTADRAWKTLDVGVEVRLVRG